MAGAAGRALAALVLALAVLNPSPSDAFLQGGAPLTRTPASAGPRLAGRLPPHAPAAATRRGVAGSVIMSAVPPKRVGIIGAGPAGLSTALALQRSAALGVEEVCVFERQEANRPNVGGGLQLNGGAAVLSHLGLGEEIHAAANQLKAVVSRTTAGQKLLELDVQSLLRSGPASKVMTKGDKTFAYLIMRDKLNEILEASLKPGTVQYGKALTSVTENSDGVVCTFSDGSSETFDLLVGCDGIRSTVRRHVVGDEGPPRYSGVRLEFALLDEGDSIEGGGGRVRGDAPPGQVEQWFCDGAYSLVATYGGYGGKDTHTACILITADSQAVLENENYKQTREMTSERMADDLRNFGFPQTLVDIAARADRTFEVGVHFHNPLVPWSNPSGRCVLLGDSAHAMPPFLGQGANQGIQDALCLTQQLEKVGGRYATVSDALKAYEQKRKFQTTKLAFNSWFLGALETREGIGAQFRNTFFNVMGKVGVVRKVFLDGATPVGVDL